VRIKEATAEHSLARFEREIFIGFYAIRKLLETFKVSSQTRRLSLTLASSPSIGVVDYMNAHRIDELFNLEIADFEQRDLEFVCNQFIHSFVFIPVQHENGSIAGAYIASDKAKREKIYFVELRQILLAFRTVGTDYPAKLLLERNEKTLQWEEHPQ
jgi:hypothetical protein